jgi:hypothetical protein
MTRKQKAQRVPLQWLGGEQFAVKLASARFPRPVPRTHRKILAARPLSAALRGKAAARST